MNDDFGKISVPELNFAIRCNHSLSRAIILHELIITHIFVKLGLNALKAATPLVLFFTQSGWMERCDLMCASHF